MDERDTLIKEHRAVVEHLTATLRYVLLKFHQYEGVVSVALMDDKDLRYIEEKTQRAYEISERIKQRLNPKGKDNGNELGNQDE